MLPTTTKPANRKQYKRDMQVRAAIRRLRSLAGHLEDRRYLPLLRSFCEISLLIEKSYSHLRDESLISAETGEIRGSVDVLRRLMDTQRGLARELGLSPTISANLFPKLTKPTIDLEAVRAEYNDTQE